MSIDESAAIALTIVVDTNAFDSAPAGRGRLFGEEEIHLRIGVRDSFELVGSHVTPYTVLRPVRLRYLGSLRRTPRTRAPARFPACRIPRRPIGCRECGAQNAVRSDRGAQPDKRPRHRVRRV